MQFVREHETVLGPGGVPLGLVDEHAVAEPAQQIEQARAVIAQVAGIMHRNVQAVVAVAQQERVQKFVGLRRVDFQFGKIRIENAQLAPRQSGQPRQRFQVFPARGQQQAFGLGRGYRFNHVASAGGTMNCACRIISTRWLRVRKLPGWGASRFPGMV